MQGFNIVIYKNSMMKSFWHFNLDFFFLNGTGITASYLHVCLSEKVPLQRPSPRVCLLTWREEPSWNNE